MNRDRTAEATGANGGHESAVAARERRMLEAARKVFHAHGFFAATTDMIQREAGVSKSTLYHRFGSKEGMLGAVIRHDCQRFREEGHLEDIPAGSLRENLTHIGTRFMEMVLRRETAQLFRIVLEVSPFIPELCELHRASGPERMRRVIQDVLRRGDGDGAALFAEEDIVPASRLFLAMLREPFLLQILYPDRVVPREEIASWVACCVEKFLLAYGCPCSGKGR